MVRLIKWLFNIPSLVLCGSTAVDEEPPFSRHFLNYSAFLSVDNLRKM